MSVRLQKYMARCGVSSRRKCEEIILQGRVKVNNSIVKELGTKINPEIDYVYVDGKIIKPEERKLYIALNKPIGYVSTVKDERGRKTVIDLVDVSERIYPIGRLDYNTSGLILLTNDGDIYNKIIHPSQLINKTYVAIIEGIPSNLSINKFCNGLDIGDKYITAPADFQIIKKMKNSSKVKITIHEGRNRQIRRMCEAINHPVKKLTRISIGKITLNNLKEGTWRHLSKSEIKYIKSL